MAQPGSDQCRFIRPLGGCLAYFSQDLAPLQAEAAAIDDNLWAFDIAGLRHHRGECDSQGGRVDWAFRSRGVLVDSVFRNGIRSTAPNPRAEPKYPFRTSVRSRHDLEIDGT